LIGFIFLAPVQMLTPVHVIGKSKIPINLFWDAE